MKKEVRLALKPAERRTSTCAPERNAMRRQKLRCSQSCLRGSRKMPKRMSAGTTRKKCNPLMIHRIALRNTSHARFIYRRPRPREECRVPGTPTEGQGSPTQQHNAHEDAEQITEIAKRLEQAIGQSGDIRRKAHAQKIEGINFAGGVRQAQKVDGASAAFEKPLHRSCGSVFCKIAQEGIAGTQRQETQRDALNRGASRKNAVEDFVSGAITADGKKAPVALPVGFAGKLHRVARTRRSNDVDLQPFLEQTRESGPSEFRGAAATGGGVDDGEESIHLERERTRNANSWPAQSFPTGFTRAESRPRCPASRDVLPKHCV